MAKTNTLIIGTGLASKLLVKEIKRKFSQEYEIVGFLDDFKQKEEKFFGKLILGRIEELSSIASKFNVNEVIIAIPSLKEARLKQIIELCEKIKLKVKILPPSYEGLYSLKTGRPWIGELRPVNLEDLLRRDPIAIDLRELKEAVSKKTILVTGGGGSIGRELCRQILNLAPSRLIVMDNCEFNLYSIAKEMADTEQTEITFLIGDVKDKSFLERTFKDYRIDIIFHAAAYKHVPLMESNIHEVIKNNIFGTYNLASAAEKYNVSKFVMVSTDKAVNPTSIMGCTKRVSELILQLFDKKTEYITVRFGNVLGSTGSVIPLFEEQIKKGGPLTLTHPDIKRFFMTIPEAAQLIIQAGTIGKDKEILVLDMGKQHKIKDVAESLIHLHGLEEKDIKIVYTGLRPGEKLYEELFSDKERLESTKNERIFISKSETVDLEQLKKNIDELQNLLEGNTESLIKKLKEIVPNYHPYSEESKEESKILITGAAGFIGTSLKRKLDSEEINYIDLSEKDKIDLSNPEAVKNLPKCSVVIHLASQLPQKGAKTFEKDILMMQNIAAFCKKNNARLIFSSSCAVYGDKAKEKTKESCPVAPLNEYGASKLQCENIMKNAGINGIILRLFNVYGQGQYKTFLIPKLLDGLKENKITLKRNIKRDFVHVDDVVQSILKAINLQNNGVEIFNIGSGEANSLEEILGILLEETGREVSVSYLKSNPGEITNSCADISKAKEVLGWEPKIFIEEGLRDLITQINLNNTQSIKIE